MAGNEHQRVPPKHTQFKPGTSGNPKGRPRGSRNFKTVLQHELDDRVQIRENGKVKRVAKLDAAVKTNIAKTIQGDPRHTAILMKSIEKLEGTAGQAPSSISDEQRREILQRYEARQRTKFYAEFEACQRGGQNDEN